MAVTSAIVLYVVIWFMTFLIALPIRVKTQGDLGDVVPGTHAGAPVEHHLKKKMWIVTGVAFVLWVIVSGIILSGWISVDDIESFTRGQASQ
jgi:predicted secreted protein